VYCFYLLVSRREDAALAVKNKAMVALDRSKGDDDDDGGEQEDCPEKRQDDLDTLSIKASMCRSHIQTTIQSSSKKESLSTPLAQTKLLEHLVLFSGMVDVECDTL
jgi:hypothetical protein